MNKKIFISIILVFIIAFLGFFIYRSYLGGTKPVINGSPKDGGGMTEEKLGLKLPENFSISIFAKNIDNPRVMTFDPNGNLIASLTTIGKVVALPDRNNDGKADEEIVILDKLKSPHGLAFRCTDKCLLYIAEENQVAVYDYDYSQLKASNKREIADLPSGGGHFTRTLLFMPSPNDSKLLISVGSSCNVCNEKDERRAKILAFDVDKPQAGLKTFARGLRNSVFMTIHPVVGKIWATEMGRDLLGDDLPPDEINIIEEDKNYGWPICYGKNIHDDDFDKNVYIRNPCMAPFETPSHIDIPAHSAPLGLTFIPEEGWPEEYWHNLLVAYHGSWNRSEPTGYKVVRYKLDAKGNYLGEEDFISGWLTKSGEVAGRPVGIVSLPGGTIYISDDKAGVIYKVSTKDGN